MYRINGMACTLAVFLMTGCAAATAEAKEQEEAAPVTAETETTALTETEAPAESADAETAAEYDHSEQHGAYAVIDGDDLTGGTYTSEADRESAVEASGTASASVTGALIKKTAGSADADEASFEGVNSAVRAYDSAELTLKDCVIEADGDNSTGVFAYDDAVINIYDSTVNVDSGGAGGIQVAGGGTLYAYNLNVTSTSKAAVRSDRGGGVLLVDGGTYLSTGSSGAPAIYSTAEITVSNAELSSENSRAVIIEGKNSVTVNNCTLTGNGKTSKEGSLEANVLLYQSASGDAENGESVFTISDSTLISKTGAMFWCTNTLSTITLTNTELVSETDDLLIVSSGRWGKEGRNGGTCTLNAVNQTMTGAVTVDDISSLVLNMTASSFSGSINNENSSGTIAVTMDPDSTWTLTADSYVTSFDGDLSSVDTNGYTLYINGTAAA